MVESYLTYGFCGWREGGGGADAEEGKHCLIRHAPQIRFQ